MYTEVMKWVSIAALLTTLVFWSSASPFQVELNLVVSAAAAVVILQAYQARNYRWATGFVVIVLLFNPLFPVFRLTGAVGLALVVLAIAPFAMSLIALKPLPMLSIPSITGRTPGSRSL